MNPGKIASQAGHAYLQAYLKASNDRQINYHADGIGTKICLVVPNLEKLKQLYELAKQKGIPCVLIEDTGKNTCFNGLPTITAVGIGPLMKHEFPELKKISLLK